MPWCHGFRRGAGENPGISPGLMHDVRPLCLILIFLLIEEKSIMVSHSLPVLLGIPGRLQKSLVPTFQVVL
jgi:hypothetical protein